MSRPFVAPGHRRSRRRRGSLALTTHGRHAALVVWIVLAACTAQRQPLPLDSPDESTATAPEPTPAARDQAAVTSIEEEALPADDTAAGAASAPPTDSAVAVEPPALSETIDASTEPNVAAATRLVDVGRAQLAAGDDGAALDQLERAIAIDPANPYAYYYLAELHFAHRTYDQAIAFADRSATLSDAREPEWASRAYTLQGNAFEAVGRFADARDAYARAIQAAPGNFAAQVGLARVGGPPPPQP